MRILITGAKGQLGNALREVFIDEQLTLVDLPELDLASFADTLACFREAKPELVIHCAAKTQVDECELKPTEAYRGNVLVTKNVVNSCQAIDAELVYISTDYVFDGISPTPRFEYETPNPLSVYGRTKHMGEEIVKTHLSKFYIARTAWLFGDVGHNFVRTMVNLAREGKDLRVVDDQFGSPTYATDLAVALAALIKTKAYGIYHLVNDGTCSWYEFTKQILAVAGINGIKVEPITTKELNRPAPRPAYSYLAKDALTALEITLPDYQDALRRFFAKN